MGNKLIYLSLMLKGSSSVVKQSCSLQQDFLCSSWVMPVERSEKTILPIITTSCVSMDHSANHAYIKTFPVDSQMIPCVVCDLPHPLFLLITVPFDCTDGLFLWLFHAVNIIAVTLVFILIHTVCVVTHTWFISPCFAVPAACIEPMWWPNSRYYNIPNPLWDFNMRFMCQC